MVFPLPILPNHRLSHPFAYSHPAAFPHLHNVLEGQFAIRITAVRVNSSDGLLVQHFPFLVILTTRQIAQQLLRVHIFFIGHEFSEEGVFFVEGLGVGVEFVGGGDGCDGYSVLVLVGEVVDKCGGGGPVVGPGPGFLG